MASIDRLHAGLATTCGEVEEILRRANRILSSEAELDRFVPRLFFYALIPAPAPSSTPVPGILLRTFSMDGAI